MEQDGTPTSGESDLNTPAKLLYVMGAGRSGSTILGVALGNCEGVFYAGELDKWLPHAGVSPLPGADRARFWDAVAGAVDAHELFGHRARCLERSQALFKPWVWRRRRRLRPRYLQLAARLIESVAGVAGASYVVDSSHYPLRARELQRLDTPELHLLFLVRDPHAVVASFAREDVPERSLGVLAANAYLWLTHLLCTWVFLRQPSQRRLLVRHEDFLADPPGVLAQIMRQAGISGAPPELSALRTGPAFQANRLVREDTVVLEPGRPPRPPRSLVTTLAQAPWSALFALLAPRARDGAGAGSATATLAPGGRP